MAGPVLEDPAYCSGSFELENEISVQTELTMAEIALLETAAIAWKRGRETGNWVIEDEALESLGTPYKEQRTGSYGEDSIKIGAARSLGKNEQSRVEDGMQSECEQEVERATVDGGSNHRIEGSNQQKEDICKKEHTTDSGVCDVIDGELGVKPAPSIPESAIESEDVSPKSGVARDSIQVSMEDGDNRDHRPVNMQPNQVFYGCKECNTVFETFSKLNRHVTEYHKCIIAEMTSAGEYRETQHGEGDKGVDGTTGKSVVLRQPYGCSLCDTGFATVDCLENHVCKVKIRRKGFKVNHDACDDPVKLENVKEQSEVSGDECDEDASDDIDDAMENVLTPKPSNKGVNDDLRQENSDETLKDVSKQTNIDEPIMVDSIRKSKSRQENHSEALMRDVKQEHSNEPVKDDSVPENSNKTMKDEYMQENSIEPIKDDSMKENRNEAMMDELILEDSNEPVNDNSVQENSNAVLKNNSVVQNIYGCSYCDQGFPTIAKLSNHLHEHVDDKPRPFEFKCLNCKCTFSSEKDLVAHQKTHKSKPKHHCGQCDKVFDDKSRLTSHLKCHENKIKQEKIACQHCKKVYRNKSNFYRHMSDVHGISLHPGYKCEVCQTSFESKMSYDWHNRDKHPKPSNQCKLCKKSFSSMNALADHMKEHVSTNNIICNVCFKVFSSEELLSHHKSTDHAVQKYKCEICGETFADEMKSDLHMQMHSMQIHLENFKCSVCDKSFMFQLSLDQHIKNMHVDDDDDHVTKQICGGEEQQKPNGYECKLCKESFSEMNLLTDHLKEHVKPLRNQDFFCEVCYKMFPSKELLSRHKTTKHAQIRETYPCEICGKIYQDYNKLTTHMDIHAEKFKCNVCGLSFVLQAFLERHMIKHEGVDNSLYRCSTCELTFVSKKNLDKHMKIHAGVKPHKCTLCDKEFTFKNHLMGHINMYHVPGHIKRPVCHSCPVCEKQFKKKSKLELHMLKHTNVKEFLCDICGAGMKSKKYWMQHMRRRHGSEQKLLQCPTCGKMFRTKQHLHRHEETHEKQKLKGLTLADIKSVYNHQETHRDQKFKCSKCDKEFTYKRGLKLHEETHSGQTHSCSKCDKVFVHRKSLYDHQDSHRDKKFKCSKCDKEFTFRSSLRVHQDTHSGQKFSCSICDKVFAHRKSLSNHLAAHGRPKFKCTQCDKEFTYRKSLLHHEGIHTGQTFNCSICDKAYVYEDSLRHHEKSHWS